MFKWPWQKPPKVVVAPAPPPKVEPVIIEKPKLLHNSNLPLVIFDGNRLGLIDHLKEDGNLGIRPLTSSGQFLPNRSTHWSEEQKAQVPDEYAIHPSKLRPPKQHEIPACLKSSP